MPRDVRAPGASDRGQDERTRLKQGWEEAFGSPPPPRLSVALMTRVLSYARQCRDRGGLPPSSERALRSVAAGHNPEASRGREVSAGAQLVREWNGRTYRVEVVEGGYRFDDRIWPSLSAIAGRITGTNWSGPRFFGLTDRRRS